MAQIVRHRETASRWKLGVEHGLAVILDSVEEVDGLLGLCRFAPSPQEPLRGVFDALHDRSVSSGVVPAKSSRYGCGLLQLGSTSLPSRPGAAANWRR